MLLLCFFLFFFNDTATTEIYTLSLHDALPIYGQRRLQLVPAEYEDGGPCYKLHQWLQQNARDYGFFFPYARYQGGVAAEPWHLSYAPLALPCQNAIDIDTLKDLLATQDRKSVV